MPIRVICPGCKRTINAPDSRAGTTGNCPGCGAAVAIPAAAQLEPMVIEATSKRWKLLQLIGGVGIALSVILIGVDLKNRALADPGDYPLSLLTVTMLMASVPTWIAGRLGAWWYHS